MSFVDLKKLFPHEITEEEIPAPSETYEVAIMLLNGKSIRIPCSQNDSIAYIKEKIRRYFSDIHPRRQLLFYGWFEKHESK